MSKANDALAWAEQRIGCPSIDAPAEEWKPIGGIDGIYLVSNIGNIMNAKSGIVLKPYMLPNGYLCVKIPSRFGRANRYIHRLVAEAFCDHPSGCNVVNHKDNCPQNNRADNLEWTTQRENVLYAMKQGRVSERYSAKEVIGIKNGKEYRFRSMNEAADFAGCDSKTVWSGCKTGRISQSGFLWREVH